MSATDTQVLDAEIVPEDAPPVSTEIVRRERRSEVIRALDSDDLVASMDAHQDLMRRLLNDSDYQDAGSDGKFVKKSGWRKIATAYDLDVTLVSEEVDRADDGTILRSKCVARAVAPSGRVMEGDGYCTRDEFVGKRARNPKLENDLRGTAMTRAKNRAISDLVGMGEVSAEEVSAGADTQAPPPVPRAEGKALTNAANAVALMLKPHIADDDERQAQALFVLGEIERDAGCDLSRHHAGALVLAAKAILAAQNVTTAPEGEAAPDGGPTGPQEDAAPPAASSTPRVPTDDDIPF